jgi:hypothetical protein
MLMSERMTTLLDAVDALTLPTTVKVIQGPGKPTVIKHEPLLTQLEAAVAGNTGSHEGSSKTLERIPIDPGALELKGSISSTVMSWQLRLSKSVKFDTVAGQLRAWYAAYIGTVRTEHTDLQYERILTGWNQQITNMFDPPTRLEITAPCPLCNARVSVDPGTGNQVTAVVVEYLEIGADTLDQASGSCRACGVVWKGRSALRELRWLIELAEAAAVA